VSVLQLQPHSPTEDRTAPERSHGKFPGGGIHHRHHHHLKVINVNSMHAIYIMAITVNHPWRFTDIFNSTLNYKEL
jgi:hypothetical protein